MKSRSRSKWLGFLTLILLAGQLGCGGSRTISPTAQVASATFIPAATDSLLQPAQTATLRASDRVNIPTLELAGTASQPPDLTITSTATPLPVVTLSPTTVPLAGCPMTTGADWAFTYGDSNFNMVDGIVPTSDGGVVFVGNGGAFIPGAYVVWSAKFNPDGSVAWKKAYIGTTGDNTSVAEQVLPGRIVIANGERAFAISEQDGSVVWQMSTQEPGPAIDTPDGGFALVREKYVIKFDSQAKKSWQVAFENGYWMWPTPKGEFVFARAFNYADPGSIYRPIYTDIEVIKVNAEGKIAWQKIYGKSLGDDETLDAMILTQDGGVLLAGTHYGSGEVGETDIWVLKLSSGGSLSWQATLSGKWWDDVYRLAQAPNGEYFLAGHAGVEIGEDEILIAKFKTNGTLAWQKTLSDYGGLEEIAGLADGGVLVSISDDPLLVRLDRSGNLVWDKTYDPGQYFTSLMLSGGSLLLGGRSSGQAVMINLQDAGAASGVIQVKDSSLKVSTSMGSRPNQKLEISQTEIAVKSPGIRAVDVELLPTPLCLAEGGLQIVPTRTSTVTPVVTPSPTPPPFTRSLYLTSPPITGDDVLALQTRLQALGYTEVGTPDGVFGALTDQAVRHFQKRNGLEVDGVVGPKTWERLFSAAAICAG